MANELMIELKDLIAILGILVANGTVIATVFTKLNIKIASLARDVVAIKANVEEYRSNSKEDLKEFKDIVLRDKLDNKEDHKMIVAELGSLVKNISDMRVDVIKAIKDKK